MEFDLRPFQAKSRQRRRSASYVGLLGLTFFLALWLAVGLPLFFEPPHALTFCFRGVCGTYPASDYALVTWFLTTVLLSGVGAMAILFVWVRVAKLPTALRVDSEEVGIEYGPSKSSRFSWSYWDLYLSLTDFSESVRARPKDTKDLESPFWFSNSRHYIPVPEDAFQAILSTARSKGLRVEVVKGRPTDWPEIINYRVRPAAKSPPTAASP